VISAYLIDDAFGQPSGISAASVADRLKLQGCAVVRSNEP
jgi:hypothetical protein